MDCVYRETRRCCVFPSGRVYFGALVAVASVEAKQTRRLLARHLAGRAIFTHTHTHTRRPFRDVVIGQRLLFVRS